MTNLDNNWFPNQVFEDISVWQRFSQGRSHDNYKKILLEVEKYFTSNEPTFDSISEFLKKRSDFFDLFLKVIWNKTLKSKRISLVAVGGYGRGALHPQSDLDLLVLAEEIEIQTHGELVEEFLTQLWDANLIIGHSVRSIEQCISFAKADITINTNLLEHRLIAGNKKIYNDFCSELAKDLHGDTSEFFHKKLEEQENRYKRHGNTEYNLEPNVKETPGGLRDLQLIDWISTHFFKKNDRRQLVSNKILSESDLDLLRNNESFLWRVRYEIHLHANRIEERLLFDYQTYLAKKLGYFEEKKSLGVERFMQDYYRVVSSTRELTDMILKWFGEQLKEKQDNTIDKYNERFVIHNGFIDTIRSSVFFEQPSAIIEIFVILAENKNIVGLRASTIKQLRDYRYLIDDEFREQPTNKNLFIRLLHAKSNLPLQLRRMSRYGILGAYLPNYKNIVGLTQHDLFHIYPVEVHTIKVIENLISFGDIKKSKNFRTAFKIFSNMENQGTIVIAALFHDIAKGRGGNHSELGAIDVRSFAIEHNLPETETNTLEWLVRNHLLMSSVSQREDIADPDVVRNFADKVKDVYHLDLLYILTVADICATNPDLWTDWKSALMSNLYISTKKLFESKSSIEFREVHISDTKAEAAKLISTHKSNIDKINELWSTLNDDFFVRELPENIAKYSESILSANSIDAPTIVITDIGEDKPIATEIFVYARDQDKIFAKIANVLDQHRLSIQDARLETTTNNFAFDTFHVLNHNNKPIGEDHEFCASLSRDLSSHIMQPFESFQPVSRKVSRTLRQFKFKTSVEITTDETRNMSRLELVTPDRGGLLAHLSQIFIKNKINLENAKIATLGERVEDTFYVTDLETRQPVGSTVANLLAHEICQELDNRNNI